MGFDFSFDKRVAQRYNAQRAHPPEVSRSIGKAIAAASGVDARVLEIGVGTGRIARPAAEAGCRVVGFDLSQEMLAETGAQAVDAGQLSLLQADMHHFPFPANTFDAVTAVHVLHLAKDWQRVIHEIARVLNTGGVFIQGDDWMDPQSVIGLLRDELRRAAIAMSPDMKPPAAGISKKDALAALGGTAVSESVAAEWTFWLSPNERLATIENRMDAESWFLPDPIFNHLLQHLRDFAANTWDDLDEKQPITRRFLLKTTRGSW